MKIDAEGGWPDRAVPPRFLEGSGGFENSGAGGRGRGDGNQDHPDYNGQDALRGKGQRNVDAHKLEENPSRENPGLFMFYENWRSREDWDLHMRTPYLKEWADLCYRTPGEEGVCDGPPELTVWERVDLPTSPVFRGTALDPKKRFALTARIYARPGFVDQVGKEILSLVPLAHTEPGCVNYDMHVNINADNGSRNPRQILIYGTWYDYGAWNDIHMRQDYMARWFDLSTELTDHIVFNGCRQMDPREGQVADGGSPSSPPACEVADKMTG